MDTVILTGNFAGGEWRWEFTYSSSSDNRFVCKRNGSEDEELKTAVLEAMTEAVAPRVTEKGLSITASDVAEDLNGGFSLSCAEGRILTSVELEELKASLRNALTAYMDSDPDAGKKIVENAWLSARARAAALKVREIVSRKRNTLNFPELPKRIRWAMPSPDIHAMRLDLLATFQAMESDRGLLASVQKLQKNLQQRQDANVLKNFKSDYDRARDLLDEKLDLSGLGRSIRLPGDRRLRLEFIILRSGRWQLQLEFRTPSSLGASKSAILSARIGELPGLKRRRGAEGVWYISLGPVNDLAAFRKTAWPVYVRIYNALRAICLEIFAH